MQPPEAGGALAAPSAHVAAQAFSARRRTLAFVVVALAFVMDLLDVTIVHVALPSIRAGLGAGASALQWTIAGYALAFAVLLVSGGRLGDVFGYRRLFLVGVAAFTLASGLCGLAMAPWQLVAARGLQGASGALMVPQVMALMQVMYPPQERFRVFAIFGLLGGVSAALGPVVGGLLIEADLFGLGWRSAFLINLPVGLLSLVAGARLLPHGAGTQPKRVDGVGTLLATATALALVLPLMQGPEAGWPAWCAALLVLALPLALLTWKAWQRRQARDGAALVDPALLAQPALRLGLTAGLALHGVVPAYLLVMTFVVQGGLHASPEQMALLCVPIAAGAAFGIAVLSQRVVPRWGTASVAVGAAVQAAALVLTGLTAHALLGAPPASVFDLRLLAGHALLGIGIGLIGPALTTATLHDVPLAEAGSASGVLSAAQQMAAVLALAAVGGLMFQGAVRADDPAALQAGLRRALPYLLGTLAVGGWLATRLARVSRRAA